MSQTSNCTIGQLNAPIYEGGISVTGTTGSVTNQVMATLLPDQLFAQIAANSSITIDMGQEYDAGKVLSLVYRSADSDGLLQVLTSSTIGGPFTNIAQVTGSENATTFTLTQISLPLQTRYVQLATSTIQFQIDALYHTISNCVTPPSCSAGQIAATYQKGLVSASVTTGTASPLASMTGLRNNGVTTLSTGSSVTGDFGQLVPAGKYLTFNYSSQNVNAFMQVSVSSSPSGPFVHIGRLDGSTRPMADSILLPIDAQYVRLNSGLSGFSFYIDAVTFSEIVCVPSLQPICGSGEALVSYEIGLSSNGTTTGTTNPNNILGNQDGVLTQIPDNTSLTSNFASVVPAGTPITIRWNTSDVNKFAPLHVETAPAIGGTFTNIKQMVTTATVSNFSTETFVLPFDAQSIRMTTAHPNSTVNYIDAVTYKVYDCVAVPPVCPSGEVGASYQTGLSAIVSSTGSVGITSQMLGPANENVTVLNSNSNLIADFGLLLSKGTELRITYTNNTTVTSYISASANAGGPFYNISALSPGSTPINLSLPFDARYIRIIIAPSSAVSIDAVTYKTNNCVPNSVPTCSSTEILTAIDYGLSTLGAQTGTVTDPNNILGSPNGTFASITNSGSMIANFAAPLPAGTVLSLSYKSALGNNNLLVEVSPTIGGSFTHVASLPPTPTGTYQFILLPQTTQSVRLTASGANYNVDAITYPVYSCVPNPLAACPSGQTGVKVNHGLMSNGTITGTVTTPANITGVPDGLNAVLAANASIQTDMGTLLPAGTVLTFTYLSGTIAAPLQIQASTVAGGPFATLGQLSPSTSKTTSIFTLPIAAQYFTFATNGSTYSIDAVTYPTDVCVTLVPAPSCAGDEVQTEYAIGVNTLGATTGTVTTGTNIIGPVDDKNAVMAANSTMIANFASVLPAGTTIFIKSSSTVATAPLQIATAPTIGGSFVDVYQVVGSTDMTISSFVLPYSTQSLRLSSDATTFNIDAITYTEYACVPNPVSCPDGQINAGINTGLSAVGATTGSVSNPANIIGLMDGTTADMGANASLITNFSSLVPAGTPITITYRSGSNDGPLQIAVSPDGLSYTTVEQISSSTSMKSTSFILPIAAQYFRYSTTTNTFKIDAVTYETAVCVTPVSSNCTSDETTLVLLNGVTGTGATTGSVTTPANLVGINDNRDAILSSNSSVVADMGVELPAGTTVAIRYSSNVATVPLQVLTSTAAGGPFTDITQLFGSTSYVTGGIFLPYAARYIKLQSGATTYNIDALMYTADSCLAHFSGDTCSTGFRSVSYKTGAQTVVTSTSVTTPNNALGLKDNRFATCSLNSTITIDLGATVSAGDNLFVQYYTSTALGQIEVLGASTSGGPYTHLSYLPYTNSQLSTEAVLTLFKDVSFVQLRSLGASGLLDAVMFNKYECTPFSGLTGCVFFDANDNGKYEESSERGIGGVTVNVYDAAGVLVSTVLTNYENSATFTKAGTYEVDGLTVGAPYRLEYVWPEYWSLYSSMAEPDSKTSVQFTVGGKENPCFGLYSPSQFCSTLPNPRVALACGIQDAGIISVSSWLYYDRFARQASGVPNATGREPASHTGDITFAQIGTLWGLAAQKSTNLIFAGAMGTDMPSVFPTSTYGMDALWILNYNSANGLQDFVGNKFLVKLSDLGVDISTKNPTRNISPTFGEMGLGGLDISDDGKVLYVVNMGNGKLVRVDISGVDYNNLPATAPTIAEEIGIPASIVQCGGSNFRPCALKSYNGKIYIGGVCDGTDLSGLEAVVVAYDPVSGAFESVIRFPLDFTAGTTLADGYPQVAWNSYLANTIQPVLIDIVFADDGTLTLGFQNRLVLIDQYSGDQTGYILRTYWGADNKLHIESNGVAPPFTGMNPDYTNSDGIGNDWFYVQGVTTSHPYTFSGGLFHKAGEEDIVAGVIDPNLAFSTGATYLSTKTGLGRYDAVLDGSSQKISRLTGSDLICNAEPTHEIGNRIWVDTNNDGVQGADEPGIAGVEVLLYADFDKNGIPDGSALAVTTTNNIGTWYFNATNVPDGDPTMPGAQIGLLGGTGYIVQIGTNSWDSATNSGIGPLTGYDLTQSNVGGTGQPNVRDNDAVLTAMKPSIALTTLAVGYNDHTFDFGFILDCDSITNPSPAQTVCQGQNGMNITVETDFNTTDGVRFVLFDTDQTAINGTETAIELANIYAGVGIDTVTPVGTVAPYTATYIWDIADFTAPDTFYVYAILNPDLGVSCRPVQEVQVIILAAAIANAGTDGSTAICDNSTTAIDLFSVINGEQVGGTWTRTTGTGGTFNAGAGTFIPASGATTSTFTYMIGTSPCPDSSVATVNISPAITASVTVATGSATVCVGAILTLNANVTNLTPDCTIQWQQGDGSTWTDISGAIGTSYQTPILTQNIQYQVRITCTSNPCANFSAPLQITVIDNPNASIVGHTNVCLGGVTVLDAGTFSAYTWSTTETSQTITVGAGTYLVTVTDNNGCKDTVEITVLTLPTPTVTDPTDQILCSTFSTTAITFSGTSAAIFNWTNNTPSIGLAASGTGDIAAFTAATSGTSPLVATITVTPVKDGCPGTPQTFTITVNQNPGFTLNKPTVCPGDSELVNITGLTGASPASAEYSVDAGSFLPYPSPAEIDNLAVGNHTISIRNVEGCVTTQNVTINPIIAKACIPVTIIKLPNH